jgi:hypothetical protein
MRASLVLLAAGPLIATACLPEPIYKVQRSARVPHPAAPLRSGAPLDAPFEASFGTSSAFDLRAPRLVDHTAAVETPAVQVRGELRLRLGTYGEIHIANEHSFDPSAIDPTQAPIPGGRNAWSFNAGVRYAVPVAPDVFIGLGLESVAWTLPYVEYRSCVANCEGSPAQERDTGTDNLWGLAADITPTYRTGDLTVFAGLHIAPNPTIRRKGTEVGAIDYESDLALGPTSYIVHAGAEYKLGPVSLLAQIQQDLGGDPVSYGPSFGFAIAGRLMDKYSAPYLSSPQLPYH